MFTATDDGESAAALASGPCLMAESPMELEDLALHTPADGDLAMADELMDAELFRDIEHLLDSGRTEIHEAYLAAIDTLSGDGDGDGMVVDGGLFLPGASDERLSGGTAWETTRQAMEPLSVSLAHPQDQQSGDVDVDMTHSGGADAVPMEDDADALYKVRRIL